MFGRSICKDAGVTTWEEGAAAGGTGEGLGWGRGDMAAEGSRSSPGAQTPPKAVRRQCSCAGRTGLKPQVCPRWLCGLRKATSPL